MARARGAAVLGGSFDHLHAGHRALIAAAFRTGRPVGIGVTTDAYLRAQGKPFSERLQPYRRRRAAVQRYLRRQYPGARWWLVPLHDPWGRSVEPGVAVLVASLETAVGARRVNVERRRRGLSPVRLRLVPLVRGEDGRVISARRIRAGDIREDGQRRRPLRVAVLVSGPPLTARERVALASIFGGCPVRLSPRRRVGSRLRGSRAEALRAARAAASRAEYGLGVLRSGPGTTGWLALADDSGDLGAWKGATTTVRPSSFPALVRRLASRRKVMPSARPESGPWRRTSA